ncbi:MAG: hypothetical protein WBB45_00630 [Cyclobacteriaceae bacterium]
MNSINKSAAVLLYLSVCLMAVGCAQSASTADNVTGTELAGSADITCDCYSQSILYNVPITFNGDVPGDLNQFMDQSQANCFAWQTFISLNWPVESNQTFGQPGDESFVQWETYMPSDVLFNQEGTAPPPWGTTTTAEDDQNLKSSGLQMVRPQVKLLSHTSKFTDQGAEDEDATIMKMVPGQAAPFDKPNWLGAQNSTNLWYQILVNKDYYDFINSTGYYNARVQHDSVRKGVAINFPQGQYQGAVGAIELKAAWMEVTDPENEKWNRYKLSQAVVQDATTGKIKHVTVALAGLHVLHKTKNQPTWVWATFEHVDNAPDSANVDNEPVPPYGYNLYSAECQPRKVDLRDSVVTVSCTPNTPPPYYLSQAAPVPVQITRKNPIDPADAEPINKMMRDSIAKKFPGSVWQYYELVDVIWSQAFQPDPTTPVKIPRKLNESSMLSGAVIVANTTMESYVQGTNTCTSCHKFGSIAPFAPDSVNNNVFGDFSFIIGDAKYSQKDIDAIKDWSEE